MAFSVFHRNDCDRKPPVPMESVGTRKCSADLTQLKHANQKCVVIAYGYPTIVLFPTRKALIPERIRPCRFLWIVFVVAAFHGTVRAY